MTSELARRFAVTIGALLIFRLGSHIPITGSWPVGAASSSAIAGVSIFALGVIPYASAAIIIRLVSMLWRWLGSLEHAGEAGRRRVARYTLLLTLVLALLQAFGIASALQDIPSLVAEPGSWFVLSATASMVGGVFFLIWLSEQITVHGIGNGLALVLAVPILISLPADVVDAIAIMRQGSVSSNVVLFSVLFYVAAVALIVFVETARRNVRVDFAARQIGKRLVPPQSTILPIKINSAGFVVPVTVASWLINLPVYLLALAAGVSDNRMEWLTTAYQYVLTWPIYLPLMISIASFVLVFIYTAYVLDIDHIAEQLMKQGGVVAGVEPGEPTADYLDRVISLTTTIGAVYLMGLLLIPQLPVLYSRLLPYKFSGGSMLIVVCTILDIQKQVRDVSLTNKGGGRR